MMNKGKNILVYVPFVAQDGLERFSGIVQRQTERQFTWFLKIVRDGLTPTILNAEWRDGIDGIISCGFQRKHAMYLRDFLRQRKVPMVVMDPFNPQLFSGRGLPVAFVKVDNAVIGKMAAQILSQNGTFASYAFIFGDRCATWAEERKQAFANVLAEQGISCLTRTIGTGRNQHTEDFIRNLPKPAALFAANDITATDILDICRRCGIRVPEEVSVLGVDNESIMCCHSQPALSSIHPEFEEEGRLAVDMLHDLMRGRQPPKKPAICGIGNIVLRHSTWPSSPAGRLVTNADEFIRLHLAESFTVSDIARHLRVSRRLLDLRYRQIRHKSVLEAIIERRLQKAADLLLGSTLAIGEIGTHCGFQSEAHFKMRFKTHFGMTMRDYRRRGRENG